MDLILTEQEIKSLFAPVLPCVGKDDTLPALMSVRIETRGEWLTAMTTDRYRAALCRIKPKATPPADLAVNVPAAAIREVMRTFKGSRATRDLDAVTVRFAFTDGSLTVSRAEGLLVGPYVDTTVTFELHDWEFPKVWPLFVEHYDKTPSLTEPIAFRPQYVAAFEAATDGYEPLTMRASAPDKPIIFTSGDHFVGMLMPIRVEGQKDPLPWSDLFSPAPVKKSRARKGKAAA